MAEDDPLALRLHAITALWRQALASPLHAPGCGCIGGFAVPPPSAQYLEEDILDYLCQRYAEDENPVLPALLGVRVQQMRAGDADGFMLFLMRLAAQLPDRLRDAVLDDVAITLGSFAPVPGASRFVCT